MGTETELIKKAAKGDARAFKALFDSHHEKVYHLCVKISGNRGDAEDLTQETFVRAYKSLPSFRHESAFGTWIYRIAANLSFNHVRKRRRFREKSFHDPDSARCSGEVLDAPDTLHPEQVFARKERERIIAWAIGSLPERQRIVIALQRYEGLSVQEIAKNMHWSVASVQSLLARAKQNLFKKLLPYAEEIV